MKSVDVFYQGEHGKDVEHVEVDGDVTLAELKQLLIEKHSYAVDSLLFVEEEDEPATEGVTVASVAGKSGLKVHMNRCRRVSVSVAYAGKTASKPFAPSATVARVKKWAAEHEFGLTKDDAAEHLLQIAGSHERPAPGTHIGSLASCPACQVSFDLVPDERINGAVHCVCV